MGKKEYCQENKPFAYFSFGYNGLLIHGIEYGIDDYIIYSCDLGKTSYHKSKIRYTVGGNAYFVFNGRRIPLNQCIRINR